MHEAPGKALPIALYITILLNTVTLFSAPNDSQESIQKEICFSQAIQFDDLADSVVLWKTQLDSSFIAGAPTQLRAIVLKDSSVLNPNGLISAKIYLDTIFGDYFDGIEENYSKYQERDPDENSYDEESHVREDTAMVLFPVVVEFSYQCYWISEQFATYLKALLCVSESIAFAHTIQSIQCVWGLDRTSLKTVVWQLLCARAYLLKNREYHALARLKREGKITFENGDGKEQDNMLLFFIDDLFGGRYVGGFDIKQDIDFWLDRENDQTDKIIEALLVRIARQIDPDMIPTLETKKTAKPIPVYFDSASFISDIYADHPQLDCHRKLIAHYIPEIMKMKRGDTLVISDKNLMSNLCSFGSYYFNASLVYFGLFFDDSGSAQWREISVEPHLSFILNKQGELNSDRILYRLTLSNSEKKQPAFYAALPKSDLTKTGKKPSGFEKTFRSDSLHEVLMPDGKTNIKRLFGGYLENKIQVTAIDSGSYSGYYSRYCFPRYCAELTSGDTITLLPEDCSNGWWYNQDEPFLTDANADGNLDLVIENRVGQWIIFLQLPSGAYERLDLRSPD